MIESKGVMGESTLSSVPPVNKGVYDGLRLGSRLNFPWKY